MKFLNSLINRYPAIKQLLFRLRSAHQNKLFHQPWVAYEPQLIPPPYLMRQEGIDVLEEWFRWAEEWSMLLRVYGRISRTSQVLEIGCGLGRTAFPLRYILSAAGRYDGFEISKHKVEFLQAQFEPAYPNFHFTWANVHNTYYNPQGQMPAREYRFPYEDNSFTLIYAASVFTHMLPEAAANYFYQSARTLKPDGRCVFSFFLLDNYRPSQPRSQGFARSAFNFDHNYADYGANFAVGVPDNPEEMTAYRASFVEQLATEAGLELVQEPVPGFWSGSSLTWVGAQDLIILRKR